MLLNLLKTKMLDQLFLKLYLDLDANLLRPGIQTGTRGLKDYLKVNGGVRVYRDKVRVL